MISEVFVIAAQQDLNDITGICRFQGLDFRLRPKSRAVDAARILANVNDIYIGKTRALPGDSKILTAPYFETLIKALTNADLFGGDRKRLIGFCPRKSAFKTGVTGFSREQVF